MMNTLLVALVLAACGTSTEPAHPEPAHAEPAAPAQAAAPAEAAKPASLAVGDPAPDVTFTLQDGSTVALSSLKGKQVLVYFYPKDETPGCTAQAEGLRDDWPEVQAAGLQVFGVSTQDAESHKAFIEKHSLPFPLVVDTGGKIATAFKVPLMRDEFAARQSFLIGADGRIKQVWLDVDPDAHAGDVIAAAKS